MRRRQFLTSCAAACGGFGFPALLRAGAPNRKVVCGVIGVSRDSRGGPGRGTQLALDLASLPNVEVATLCDVDEYHLAKALQEVGARSVRPPKGEHDLRRVLERNDLDAVVLALPDHWQATAATLACSAGKHVYLETPGGHNAAEGEIIAEASARFHRHVQLGTQWRSWPALREAVDLLAQGAIGRAVYAEAHSLQDHPAIGIGKEQAPPRELDWELWQGPAPRRPFKENFLPFNWRWFWHWGTGELGHSGIHRLDFCRWALGLDYPERVYSAGGHLRRNDDAETPDTNFVSFDFDRFGTGKLRPFSLHWQGRNWESRTPEDAPYEVGIFGEAGTLLVNGSGYVICDTAGKEVQRGHGEAGSRPHLQNFIDAIRETAPLRAPIADGIRSALLCHLGNISWRIGHAVQFDPILRSVVNDQEATKLWTRDYQPGFAPKI